MEGQEASVPEFLQSCCSVLDKTLKCQSWGRATEGVASTAASKRILASDATCSPRSRALMSSSISAEAAGGRGEQRRWPSAQRFGGIAWRGLRSQNREVRSWLEQALGVDFSIGASKASATDSVKDWCRLSRRSRQPFAKTRWQQVVRWSCRQHPRTQVGLVACGVHPCALQERDQCVSPRSIK